MLLNRHLVLSTRQPELSSPEQVIMVAHNLNPRPHTLDIQDTPDKCFNRRRLLFFFSGYDEVDFMVSIIIVEVVLLLIFFSCRSRVGIWYYPEFATIISGWYLIPEMYLGKLCPWNWNVTNPFFQGHIFHLIYKQNIFCISFQMFLSDVCERE